MVRVEDEAQGFELPVPTGGTFQLREHRGRSNVVLYFSPANFTLGCTQEACSFQKQFSSLRQSNAVVVGISPDDLETHRRFAQRFGPEFLLESDPLKKVIRQYRPIWLGGLLVKRIAFVIDKNGIVLGVIRYELLWQRHSEDVLALLRTLS